MRMAREKELIADVLADRYASAEMVAIWSPRGKVVLEREFWIAVMQAQRKLGLAIPVAAIDAYERVKDQVDLDSIRARERITRHDVKARIDEFCALAGHQHVHKGMTSRDLTENVEQIQILRALRLLRFKYVAALHHLGTRIQEFRDVALTGRTHNVPAQVTTVGKRLAMFATEMLCACRHLDSVVARYPFRGLKGAVGTQLDLLTLFGGDAVKVAAVEDEIKTKFSFGTVLTTVGQVYPRSIDFEVLAAVFQLAAGPSSLARTWRLMAGAELVSEGFKADQVGSSAMPHKINPRSCERINGLGLVLKGFVDMVMGLAGEQWNEGDVSCSVVRRVALPGAMMAMDGLLETFLTVVREMEIFPGMIAAERRRHLPFLATTTILMAAVKRGAGREEAHAAIREHSIAAARDLREGRLGESDLLARLDADPRIGLSREEIEGLLTADARFVGAAGVQIDAVLAEIETLTSEVEGAREYLPDDIL
jgi:adenylosuccinate lyase